MITVHNRSQPLRGYSLELADVRSLLRTLRELGAESRTRELQKIQSRQDLPADQKASIEKAIRDTDPVWISIYGTRGEHLFLGAAPDFLDEQLPKEIGSIFVSNLNPYRKVFNREPDLALELELDFADPLILDWQNPASGPTQNSSYILAKGDQVWTSAVIKTVEDLLSASKNRRVFFHRSFVYDLGLFLVGLPLAFLATKRLSTTINGLVGDQITTLSVMAYAYVFFSAIWLYRLLFSYMRWVLPVNEITVNARRRAPHRFILTTVLLALLGEVIHSVVVISTTP